MAVLTNPFANMTRAIGFNSFGWIAAVLEGARVVLVTELRRANPPPSSILRRMGRSFHQLVDGTRFLLLVLILLRHPSVIDSSRQTTHAATKLFAMCAFQAAIISRTSQNLSRNVGGTDDVNRNADVIVMNLRRDM